MPLDARRGIHRGLALARAVVLMPFWLLAFAFVNVAFELAGHAWALRGAGCDPAVRVTRVNALIRSWGVTLFRLTRWACGFVLEIAGEIPAGRHVVIANHQSTADIAILLFVFRDRNCKFAVKRELSRFIPSVSAAVMHGGFAVIGRETSRDDLRALREMGQGLARWDASAILFPEGTRSRDGAVLPYRRAAVRVVAETSGLPLLPVAIDGTWRASDLLRFVSGMPGRTFRVTIGAPVPPADHHARMTETLATMRQWTIDTLGACDAASPLRPAALRGPAGDRLPAVHAEAERR